MVDREENAPGYHREGDEYINDEEEIKAASAEPAVLPKKLKAVIRFGYDKALKDWLRDFRDHWKRKGETFEEYIESVFTVTQVYWRHPSLTTEVIFEVIDKQSILIRHH